MGFNLLVINPYTGLTGANLALRDLVRGMHERGDTIHMVRSGQDNMYQFLGDNVEMLTGVGAQDNASFATSFVTRLMSSPKFLGSVSKYVKKLKQLKIDVVLLNGQAHPIWGIAARFLKIPVVVHFRALHLLNLGQVSRSWLKAMEKLGAEFVANSQATAGALLGLGVSEQRVHVILNAVDARRFSEELAPVECRRPLGIDEDQPVIGYTGVINSAAGAKSLEKILARLQVEFPNIKCICAGGPEGAFVESSEAELFSSVQDAMIYPGYTADMNPIYRAMDVLVHTSPFSSFGRSVGEAMFCGVPVVSFDVGSLPETIEQGVTGFLVPYEHISVYANRVAYLLKDHKKARKMGEQGRLRAERLFNLDRNINEMTQIFSGIIPNLG